jgi:hypothetical protein
MKTQFRSQHFSVFKHRLTQFGVVLLLLTLTGARFSCDSIDPLTRPDISPEMSTIKIGFITRGEAKSPACMALNSH